MKNWTYKGEEINDITDVPDWAHGFVYEITHRPTGKKYLGRKQLVYKRKRKIGKRETEERKQKKKEAGEKNWWIVKKYKYIKKESDWLEYVGSSELLLELIQNDRNGVESCDRRILEYGHSKKHLNYLEARYLFENRVLENDEYLNSNISGKYFRKDLMREGLDE